MSRPITPEDLWKMARVGKPAMAPDGTFAVVPVTTYDVEENKGCSRLHRVARDGTAIPLTTPGTDSTAPVVSPDGTRVAFLRKGDADDAKPQVHVMPLGGGESECLTDLPLGAAALRWWPDGTSLAFLAPVAAGHEDLEATRAAVKARVDRKVKARTTEDRIYRYWNKWLTDGDVNHLFRLDIATKALTDLTPGWTRLFDWENVDGAFDISPDGGEIAFQALTTDAPHETIGFGVYTMVPGGEPRLLWPDGAPNQRRPRYSPDGSRIAFGYTVEFPGFYADRMRLAVHDRTAGTVTTLTPEWDRSCEAWEWTSDGEGLVFVAEDAARQHLWAIPSGGGDPEVLARGGTISSPSPAPDGAAWCLLGSIDHPDDVAIASGGDVIRIADFNAAVLADLELGKAEEVTFPGADGVDVQMFVLYPPGFDPSTTWPLVQNIHGGPHGVNADTWHWRWNTQVFAAAGYVVASVNFHGSSSWGNEFAASIHGGSPDPRRGGGHRSPPRHRGDRPGADGHRRRLVRRVPGLLAHRGHRSVRGGDLPRRGDQPPWAVGDRPHLRQARLVRRAPVGSRRPGQHPPVESHRPQHGVAHPDARDPRGTGLPSGDHPGP
jgi:dipeptidyl aminopeptidase/acylaminoacyl peptidase